MQTIRTALLSFGMSGKLFHAPFLASVAGFKLAGAWERTSQLITKEYGEAKSYKTLDEVLSDNDVALVVVNTPTSTHFEYASKALLAGKHVVVEKAFTTNASEAQQLDALARKQKLKLTVYQNRRWDSDFLTIKKVVEEKDLGEIVEVSISYDRFNPGLSPKLHRESPGPGSGNLLDLGPHCLDQALVLFGMPQQLFADIRTCRTGSQVDDYFEILLYYPKLRVRLHSSYFVKEGGPGYMLQGTKGSFLKNRVDVQERQLKGGMKPNEKGFGVEDEADHGILNVESGGDSSRTKVKSLPGNYGRFYEMLHAAMTKNEPVPVTPEDGIRVMKMIDAAIESSRSKKVVNLN